MFMQSVLIVICLVLIAYLSKHLYALDQNRREASRNARMRAAVDWTRPPERRSSRQRSRISDFLKI